MQDACTYTHTRAMEYVYARKHLRPSPAAFEKQLAAKNIDALLLAGAGGGALGDVLHIQYIYIYIYICIYIYIYIKYYIYIDR